MKRVQYHWYGGPDVLRLEEFDVPAPGRGELLVRVMAAYANPADFKVRSPTRVACSTSPWCSWGSSPSA
jgi:NADPH:quinone reductase-like Zn-dependent oxidoreductase